MGQPTTQQASRGTTNAMLEQDSSKLTVQQKRSQLISSERQTIGVSAIIAALVLQFQTYIRDGLSQKTGISVEQLTSSFESFVHRAVTRPIEIGANNFVAILTVEPTLLTIPQALSFLSRTEIQQMDNMNYSNIYALQASTYNAGLFGVQFNVPTNSKIGQAVPSECEEINLSEQRQGFGSVHEAVAFVNACRIAFGDNLKEIGGPQQVIVLTGATWGIRTPTTGTTPTVSCDGDLESVQTHEKTEPGFLAPSWASGYVGH